MNKSRKRADMCEHTDKAVYAKGKCKKCQTADRKKIEIQNQLVERNHDLILRIEQILQSESVSLKIEEFKNEH